MCGIAGACTPDPRVAAAAVDAMCQQMTARGPDGHGVAAMRFGDEALVLGNRRLAIIDPSPTGEQPMSDERGNTLVFNGMIYNYRELRAELIAAGERFRSECDTEVVLRAYGRFGAACVQRMHGMFAFAIWDAERNAVFMARDRLGIKPLYYARAGGGLLVASQVKALLATGLVSPQLSNDAVRSYLSYGAVSDPGTAIEGVMALPAAHTALYRNGELRIERYWSPDTETETAITRDTAVLELRQRLERSVSEHLVSDAPLGVFLSGGLDSSAIAALAAREVRDLRTVSVVFDDPAFSEQPAMDAVATHIGSVHTRVRLTADDLRASLPGAFTAMDQPTFDGINTFIVSGAAAAAGLKVALSGLGADELFDGYGYARRISAMERMRRLPRPVAAAASLALRGGNREKLDAWLGGSHRGSAHSLLRRVFLEDEVAQLMHEPAWPGDPAVPARDIRTRAAIGDLQTYTRDVLLRDTDAMSMAHSVEVRVPFLDDRLVEWTLALPPSVVRGRRKALLADAVRDLLPAAVLARRKQGFVLPLSRWLREDLRGEAETLLRRPPSSVAAVIDPEAIGGAWETFLRDGRRWLRPWTLYALCRWAQTVEGGAA